MKRFMSHEMHEKSRAAIYVIGVCTLMAIVMVNYSRVWGVVQKVTGVIMPLLIGFGIAFLLQPIVNWSESGLKKTGLRKKPRACRLISVIFAVLVLLALIAGFFAILLPQLITSIKSIMQYGAAFISMNSKRINQLLLKFEFLSIEGEQLVIAWEKIVAKLASSASVLLDNVMMLAGGISSGVYNVFFSFLVGLIAAIYMLLDKETFGAQFKKICYALFKPETCKTLIHWTRRANVIFAGFISGKIIDSMVIGLLCYIGMLIMRLEYPLLISVIVGLTNIIPFFGPFIGAVPSIIILLLIHPMSALIFAVFVFILQQLDGNFIGPHILGDYVGVSAFWIMVSIVIGGGLFGFVGMLLGVPVFAMSYAIVRTLVETQLEKKHLPIPSAEYRNAPEVLNISEPEASEVENEASDT